MSRLILCLWLISLFACNQQMAPLIGVSDDEKSEELSLPGSSEIPVANISTEDESNVSDGAEIATDVVGSYMSLDYGVRQVSRPLRFQDGQTVEVDGALVKKTHLTLRPARPEMLDLPELAVFYHVQVEGEFRVGVIPASKLERKDGAILSPLLGTGDYQLGLLGANLEGERSVTIGNEIGSLKVPPMQMVSRINLGRADLSNIAAFNYPYLAAVDKDGVLQLFDLGGLQPEQSFVRRYRLGSDPITQVEIVGDRLIFASNSRVRIQSLSSDERIRVLDVENLKSFHVGGGYLYFAGDDARGTGPNRRETHMQRLNLLNPNGDVEDLGPLSAEIDHFFALGDYFVLSSQGSTYRMLNTGNLNDEVAMDLMRENFAPAKLVKKGERLYFLDPNEGLADASAVFGVSPMMNMDLSINGVMAAAYQKKLRFLSLQDRLSVFNTTKTVPEFEAALADVVLVEPVGDNLVYALTKAGDLYQLEIREELR